MDIAEELMKYVIKYVLKHAKDEMKYLDEFVEKGLIKKLTKVRLVVLKTLEKLDLSVFTLWSPYGSGKATIISNKL